MTHHLTPEELIDGLDRPLPPARQAHAETCGLCRAERSQLDAIVRDVAAVDVPEPSPLFWDHLSARIRERVAQQPPPAVPGWLSGLWPRWALAGAVVAICASVGWIGWSAHVRRVASTVQSRDANATYRATPGGAGLTSAASTNEPDASPALDGTDHEWALMVRVAENVAWDETESASMYVRPATVEHALDELSSDERRALVQLLRAEMARRPSS